MQQLKSYRICCHSTYGWGCIFRFPNSLSVPSPPRNFALSTVEGSSRTLSASWMAPGIPNGIIANYTIRCSETASDATLAPFSVQIPLSGNTVLSTNLENLMPFTAYNCTISASTGAGEGSVSDPETGTTGEDGKTLPCITKRGTVGLSHLAKRKAAT